MKIISTGSCMETSPGASSNNTQVATTGFTQTVAQSVAQDVTETVLTNKITYGTTDIGEGAELATGVLYFVYEE